MKHNYSLRCFTVALSLCGSQLFAQKPFPRPANSGLQAYHQVRKWGGLDLQSYLRAVGLYGGPYNTATGSYALGSNTSGGYNTADGWNALSALTTASYNTAVGTNALESNNGNANTGVGYMVLAQNTTGCCNVGLGANVLYKSTASNNTAIGYSSFELGTVEGYSVAVGYECMYNSNSSTGLNTATGSYALYGAASGSTGSQNTVDGAWGLYSNTTGSENAVSGCSALTYNTTGSYNSAMGFCALFGNTSGNYNVANGYYAMYQNVYGNYNVGEGMFAMDNTYTGSYNTGIGAYANVSGVDQNNSTAVGYGADAPSSNQVVLGNSSVTSIGGYANWTNFSDGRYKKNIQQNVPGLAFINKLTPITYTLDITGIETKLHQNDKSPSGENMPSKPNYLDDPIIKQAMAEKSAITYTGFVAQDVEKAADSVGFTFSGIDKPKDVNQSFYGLRYGDFVVPLVKAVQELSVSSNSKDSAINALQGKYDSLQTQVNELRAMLLAKNASAMSGASLDQNSPNPFTESTVIGFSLPKGVSSAQMQITDITGKVLALIPLSSSAGKSTLTASLSGSAAGTYMYSLIVDGRLVSTRKMIAVR